VASTAGVPVGDDGNVQLSLAAEPVVWDYPPVVAALRAQNMLNQAVQLANIVDRDLTPLLRTCAKLGDGDTWRKDADDDLAAVRRMHPQLDAELSRLLVDDPAYVDTAAQPYNDQFPGPEDLALRAAFADGALPYFLAKGWTHAAGLFANWQTATGNTAYVDPAELMADLPTFAAVVATAATVSGDGLFDTGWCNTSTQDGGGTTQSMDWWYALNDFRYRVVGRVTIVDGQAQGGYTVGVVKPYVFGAPRSPLSVPLLTAATGKKISQEQLAHLHRCGLAQNFIVQGLRHFPL
jgi:hypothetical protein